MQRRVSDSLGAFGVNRLGFRDGEVGFRPCGYEGLGFGKKASLRV